MTSIWWRSRSVKTFRYNNFCSGKVNTTVHTLTVHNTYKPLNLYEYAVFYKYVVCNTIGYERIVFESKSAK